jgi:hypothetical protein
VAAYIDSGAMERFLVPFEHGLIARTQVARLARSVAALALPMVDEEVSQAPAMRCPWRIAVRDGLELAVEAFVMQVDAGFETAVAVEEILGPMRGAGPDEVIVE